MSEFEIKSFPKVCCVNRTEKSVPRVVEFRSNAVCAMAGYRKKHLTGDRRNTSPESPNQFYDTTSKAAKMIGRAYGEPLLHPTEAQQGAIRRSSSKSSRPTAAG